jgi:endonuclease-3
MVRAASPLSNGVGATASSSTALAPDSLLASTPPRSKRQRYVPPPPLASVVKSETDGEAALAAELASASTPVRYSLRKRNASTLADGEEEPVKEEQDEMDVKPSQSPRRKIKKEIDLFATSPRKTSAKPIKLELDASEARPAPKRWQEQYAVLTRQRKRILAPVDTLGCEENGKDEKRKDVKIEEDDEAKARRERFTCLVSLMLSSQTKDPVTAEAVHNLQRNLPGGLCLESILAASQDQISSSINKVGFWRRKTGYVQSAAQIIRDDFGGDIPKTIDELCSLPGVGPKMGFLCLQSAWNLNMGIGVDVHVHRVSNRLKWVNSNDAEGTRLQLQSWLPKELHRTINKTLVGFGQVICQPVGPRCDLCALGAARLCPSYRKVDPKSVLNRVKVELLPEDDEQGTTTNVERSAPAAAVQIEGADGVGELLVKTEELPTPIKEELDW